MALEGTYPIIIDGELAGKLTVTTQGARTEFRAACRTLKGVVRISVYGGGTEGCLGVLAPEGDGLSLHKTFSRTALRAFPTEIESVERSGLERGAIPEPEIEAPKSACVEETPPEPPVTPEPTVMSELQVTQKPEKPEETADDLFWYSSPDGALVCFDGTHSLIALPIGDERIPEGFGGQRRTVEGKEYLVYITKNGRIVH